MYTVDDDPKNRFDEEEIIEEKSWNNGTGLIVKIIIIILCVIVLIWLIKELRNNTGKKDTGDVHAQNVLKLRLGAEEYFFLKNKKEEYSIVNLAELKSLGLVDTLLDANDKTCNAKNSKAILEKGDSSYKMTISLDCSTDDDDEIFYYSNSNLACQNCNGKTIMTGTNIIEEKGEEKDDDIDISDDHREQDEYSCVSWSDWQSDRIDDPSLIERTKTLVQGVKYGGKNITIKFTDWSDYGTTPIEANEKTEVETKVETSETWSEPKTSYSVDTSNPNIRITGTSEETYSTSCPSGYTQSGSNCISDSETVGNLTYSEFNSGRYRVNNGLCSGVRNEKNSSGRYEITYQNCRYNTIISTGSYNVSSRTVYTYQEKITSSTTYYRSRTKVAVESRDEDEYTNKKYEEKDLPKGYVKVPGTEETFYSYKYDECVK